MSCWISHLYRIVACSVLNGETGAKFEYWNQITLNKIGRGALIGDIGRRRWFSAPENDPPAFGDKMIALQTCNSGADDGIRCVLFAQCLGEY